MPRIAPVLTLLFLSYMSDAAEVPPPPTALPSTGEDHAITEENFEPQVTIMRRQESTVEEYRANGQLYMVKITPDVGAAYYLIDMDGDGSLETTQHNLATNPVLPQWILFRW
jgi:hypothetical protein